MRFRHFLILCLFFFPAQLYAQQNAAKEDITGLWKGTLYNDTTKQYYKYEIGISEDKNGLSGFSHTWFILDDKQYYGVKKVKIKKEGGKIIVEDAGLIANNYPVAPAKGVRQLNVLELQAEDNIMTLTGPFSTNRTKDYRPLSGTIRLERKNDYWQSALIPHLQELNLAHNLSFVEDENLLAGNNIAIAAAERSQISAKNEITKQTRTVVDLKAIPALLAPDPKTIGIVASVKAEKAELQRILETGAVTIPKPVGKPGSIFPIAADVSASGKKAQVKSERIVADQVKPAGVAKNNPRPVINSKKEEVHTGAVKTSDATASVISQPQRNPIKMNSNSEHNTEDRVPALSVHKSDSVYAIKLPAKNTGEVQFARAIPQQPANPGLEQQATVSKEIARKDPPQQYPAAASAATAAVSVADRTTTIQQTVSFHSDSLQLSLYDNGEVDGDTVSVLMNGNIIMARERLSTNAVRKTIFIPQNTDTVQLVMYAENLGSIPPNTGLLVVKDGKDLYEIRFSGDLQKNAAIIFKRKKEIPK